MFRLPYPAGNWQLAGLATTWRRATCRRYLATESKKSSEGLHISESTQLIVGGVNKVLVSNSLPKGKEIPFHLDLDSRGLVSSLIAS